MSTKLREAGPWTIERHVKAGTTARTVRSMEGLYCAMIGAIQLTGWSDNLEKTEAYVAGFNSAAALSAEGQGQHPDDVAIDRFAAAMKAKMKFAREHKGRGGWEGCSPETLRGMLHDHVTKGDPVDVANFCMMLHAGGYRTISDEGFKHYHPNAAEGQGEHHAPVKWFNGCNQTVPEALRFLAEHERPKEGEQRFNSLHLYQLADEIERTAAHAVAPPPVSGETK